MRLIDMLKKLTKNAEHAAVEHKGEIHQAVQKAEAAADKRTGGKYHGKIAQAGDKADDWVDELKTPDAEAGHVDDRNRASGKDPAGE